MRQIQRRKSLLRNFPGKANKEEMKMRKAIIVNDCGHDFSSLREWIGERRPLVMSEGTMNIFDVDRIEMEFKDFLEKKFKEGDLLVLSGSVVLNAIACVLVCEKYGSVDVLIFNQKTRKYVRRQLGRGKDSWQDLTRAR